MADKTVFNISPYYDDYDEDKNFLRILFRPGYAVQARELTQAQTILQKQVQRFGDHVFEDGSKVLGAGTITRKVDFVRLNKTYTKNDGTVVTVDPTKILDYELIERGPTGEDGNLISGEIDTRAKVIHVIDSTDGGNNDDFFVAFVEFITGSQFTEHTGVTGALLESTILSEDYSVMAATAASGLTDTRPINGKANLVSVDDGVFYTDGFFVKNQKSNTVPYNKTNIDGIRSFENPSCRVGLNTSKTNVTSGEDETLRDPSSGSYNFNAPGGDRYKINLELEFRAGAGSTATDNQDFIELLRFDDGNITYKLDKTDYAELEKTLARRTYDESGSYTVQPFGVDIREHLVQGTNRGVYVGGSADYLAVGMLPGKAYVFGHEYETQTTEYIPLRKGRKTGTFTGSFDSNHGNYFVGVINNASDNQTGNPSGGAAYWLFGAAGNDINKKAVDVVLKQNNQNDEDTNPATIGTAKIHKIDRNTDNNFRIYVYDIKLETGQLISSVDSIYATETGTNQPAELLFSIIDNTGLVGPDGLGPHSRDENTLLFPLKTGSAIKSLSDLKYSFKKTIPKLVTATENSGELSFSLTDLDSTKFEFDSVGLVGGNTDAGKFFIFEQKSSTVGSEITHQTTLVDDAVFTKNGENLVVSNLGFDVVEIPEGLSYILVATVTCKDTTGQSSNSIRKKTLQYNKTSKIEPLGDSGTEPLVRQVDANENIYYEFPYSDVFKINSIAGTSADENDQNAEQKTFNPSDDLLFDNGQRDNEYLKGRLYVKESVKHHYGADGLSAPALTVNYEYFQHLGGPGPFTVDSYDSDNVNGGGCTYDDIPLYTSKNLRKTFSLANCIDFRHSVDSQTTVARVPDTKPTSSLLLPVQGTYDYYLSRIDKVVINNELNGDVVFDVIEGVDAIVPKPPADRDNSMTLYSLTVPAYTHNPSDVGIKLIENKRYTMKDLGRVENRLDDIEYFTTLSLLENEIDSRVIYTSGSNTDPAFKNGILVDGFRGHNIGDVSHIDYKCSIDYEKGHLRPSFKAVEVKLNTPTIDSGTNLEISDDGLLTFIQGPSAEYINQPASNTLLKVNPFNLTNWIGTVKLSPSVCKWFDTSSRPTVKINTQGENDNWKVTSVNNLKGFGTQWNDWESIWYGIDAVDDNLLDDRKGNVFLNEARVKTSSVVVTNKTENNISSVTRDASTTREEKNRVGLNIRNLPGHLKTRIDDKIVDRSIAPFIEERTITVNAYGMKPLTQVYAFFDDISVDANCVDENGTYGPFTTSWDGSLSNITFTIPSNTFETGDKLFRFTNDSQNRIADAITSADGIFYAHGLTPKRNGSVVSTRPLHLRRITANSEKVIRNPFAKEKNLNLSKYTNWLDPMSQVFYVDDISYPNGIFLDSIDLYLGNAHETIPVKLDIRESFSGSPSPSAVIPFSEVWKSGTGDAGVTYDRQNAGSATNFKFSSPVFLEPGEYAICLSANSSDFEVHGGVLGEVALDNLNRIISPIYSGPVFRSSNNRAAQVDNTLTLKYKLHRCVFKATPDTSVVLTNVSNSSIVNIDSYRFNTSSIVPSGTRVKHLAMFDNNTDIIENTNNDLSTTSTIGSGVSQNTIRTTLSVDAVNNLSPITPVVDLAYSNVVAIENVVNNLTNSTDELPAFGDENSANAKYISRRVTLEDGFESKNIKVFLDLNKQGVTADVSVDVYAKISSSANEAEFDDVGYVQMEVENSSNDFISDNQFDFREVSYTLPESEIPTENQDAIKSFAVKICLYASNSANVPLVKDLRIVALDS